MTTTTLTQEIKILKDVTLNYIRGTDAAYAEDIKMVVNMRGCAAGVGRRAIEAITVVIDSMDQTARPLRAEDVRVLIDAHLSLLAD